MSNNQWNNDQGQGQWQPQGAWNPAPQQSAGEWDRGQQQTPGWDAGAQAQGWNTAPQPQPSAQDWNTGAQTQGWNTAPQPQPSAQDWGSTQGWNAGATEYQQQGWGDPTHQAGFAPGPGQQQWQPQPPKQKSAFSNVFDFSFKKFALPEARGTIFLVAVIAIGVNWLSNIISLWTYGFSPFGVGTGLVSGVFGGLALSILYVLLVRVFLEGMSALITLSTRTPDKAVVEDTEDAEEG